MGEYKIKYAMIQIINTSVIDSSRGKSVFLFDKNDGRSACQ